MKKQFIIPLRIICFDIDTASVRHIIENEDLGRVFAIEYDRNFKLLHAISGNGFSVKAVPLGYTFDVAEGNGFGQLLETWEPEDAVSGRNSVNEKESWKRMFFFKRAFRTHMI